MEFDILYWFQSISNGALDAIMLTFSKLGDHGMLWIALSIILLCIKKYRKSGITTSIALILSLIMCNGFMKNVFQRARPCWIDDTVNLLIQIPTDYSFPSGHTSASFAAAVALFMYHKKIGSVALIIAANIAISRMYLFVHFPTDILVSVILGSLYGVISFYLIKYISGKNFKIFEKILK